MLQCIKSPQLMQFRIFWSVCTLKALGGACSDSSYPPRWAGGLCTPGATLPKGPPPLPSQKSCVLMTLTLDQLRHSGPFLLNDINEIMQSCISPEI